MEIEYLAFEGKDVIFNYMKKFKYYIKGDKNKEQVGVVNAGSHYVALTKASNKKHLSLTEFNSLFEIEEIKGK